MDWRLAWSPQTHAMGSQLATAFPGTALVLCQAADESFQNPDPSDKICILRAARPSSPFRETLPCLNLEMRSRGQYVNAVSVCRWASQPQASGRHTERKVYTSSEGAGSLS